MRGPVLIGNAAQVGIQLTWWKEDCLADVSSLAVFVIVVFTASACFLVLTVGLLGKVVAMYRSSMKG